MMMIMMMMMMVMMVAMVIFLKPSPWSQNRRRQKQRLNEKNIENTHTTIGAPQYQHARERYSRAVVVGLVNARFYALQ